MLKVTALLPKNINKRKSRITRFQDEHRETYLIPVVNSYLFGYTMLESGVGINRGSLISLRSSETHKPVMVVNKMDPNTS